MNAKQIKHNQILLIDENSKIVWSSNLYPEWPYYTKERLVAEARVALEATPAALTYQIVPATPHHSI